MTGKRTWNPQLGTANYDELKIVPYTLPDPLRFLDGRPVRTREDWPARRAEILSLFADYIYGRLYPALPIQTHLLEQSDSAFNGKATRMQFAITFPTASASPSPTLHLLLYIPNASRTPAPCFLGLNFFGNHAATADPDVILSDQWMRENGIGIVNHRATQASRASEYHRWPVEQILARGYALATVYSGDIDPDFDHQFTRGIHTLFRKPDQPLLPTDGGTISAWAWGLSRVMDCLTTLDRIDASRICLTGLSRLGKASLWAGACDPRFALVISNNSGCGGSSLSRRNFGETLYTITYGRGHWFCGKCYELAENPANFPVDQHMLIALMAPRPVFISSAQLDHWADPRGEFLSAFHAGSVYRLLGHDAIDSDQMPPLGKPLNSRVGYEIRPGVHDIFAHDWNTHLNFADKHLGR